jgi:hypothetical protein
MGDDCGAIASECRRGERTDRRIEERGGMSGAPQLLFRRKKQTFIGERPWARAGPPPIHWPTIRKTRREALPLTPRRPTFRKDTSVHTGLPNSASVLRMTSPRIVQRSSLVANGTNRLGICVPNVCFEAIAFVADEWDGRSRRGEGLHSSAANQFLQAFGQ